MTAESCNTASCGQYSFVVGAYGSCSALCGDSGTAERNVTCMHNGAAVDSTSAEYTQNCLPLGEPVSIEQCFATPCEAYMWETAAWGKCTGGMQNRTVSCQRIKGGSADASVGCSSPSCVQTAVSACAIVSAVLCHFVSLSSGLTVTQLYPAISDSLQHPEPVCSLRVSVCTFAPDTFAQSINQTTDCL